MATAEPLSPHLVVVVRISSYFHPWIPAVLYVANTISELGGIHPLPLVFQEDESVGAHISIERANQSGRVRSSCSPSPSTGEQSVIVTAGAAFSASLGGLLNVVQALRGCVIEPNGAPLSINFGLDADPYSLSVHVALPERQPGLHLDRISHECRHESGVEHASNVPPADTFLTAFAQMAV